MLLIPCILLHLLGTVKPTVHVSSPVYLNISNFTLTMKCIPEDNNSNYEWEKRNTEFPSRFKGANSSCLTILNLIPEDAGEYRCIISNSTRRIASDYATLTINGIAMCIVCKKIKYVAI